MQHDKIIHFISLEACKRKGYDDKDMIPIDMGVKHGKPYWKSNPIDMGVKHGKPYWKSNPIDKGCKTWQNIIERASLHTCSNLGSNLGFN